MSGKYGLRETRGEPSTLSNYGEYRAKHFHLDWEVDFSQTVIKGSATYTFEVLSGAGDSIILDTNALAIHTVRVENESVGYRFAEADKALGVPLVIDLPKGKSRAPGSDLTVVIDYATTSAGSALGWLPPEQTNGGQHPYLFSQCQAIHARSLFPCQDTPGVRASYTATVCVPSNLQVLMSALMKSTEVKKDTRVTTFEQPIPIASYLVAIVVGSLQRLDISERVAVWSEPDVVERAAHDFSDAEKFVMFGEELVGKYEWTRYDVVCLPGSFPYGGMENPCLTFVTPSLLTGDKSQAKTVCHEVAHSWTGNLVGPKTWEDFYLNEGFTRYLERKIMSRIVGPEYFDFSSRLGWTGLCDTLSQFGHTHPFTCLRPDLAGVDPDDAFSLVPYEKGCWFLYYLEKLVGGEERFLGWLHAYIQHFRHKPIDTFQMLDHLHHYFSQEGHKADLSGVDWKAWLDTPGLPPVLPNFESKLMDSVVALASHWLSGKAGAASDMDTWIPEQRTCFLNLLLESHDKVDSTMLTRLDAAYKFNSTNDKMLLRAWLRLCIRTGWVGHEPVLEAFLRDIGRIGFVRPLYREMKKRDVEKARRIFSENAKRYHSICRKVVASDLDLPCPA